MSANQPKRAQATTGGGPEDLPPLDEFETRVAMDSEAISGISGGQDVGAPSPGEPQQRSSSTPRWRQQPCSYTCEKLFT
ncbi:hypothetical protein MRX96_016010 [Rhipicephalus microplus]